MAMQVGRGSIDDAKAAAAILREVSEWLIGAGKRLWNPDEIADADVAQHARQGELIVGCEDGEPVACMYLQTSDSLFWPLAREGEALYIHRLAVRRAYAGRGRAREMLDWAAEEAKRSGRMFVRLDTEVRPAVIALYEDAGFVRVDPSSIVVGAHEVLRLQRRV